MRKQFLALAAILCFSSLVSAQVRQEKIFIDDGNGNIIALTNPNSGTGTFSFPAGAGGLLTTNSGSGGLNLSGNFTTSGGTSTLQFNLTGNTTLTLPTSGTLMTNPMTAVGDLIVGGSGGTPADLPSSNTVGNVLTVTSTNGGIDWEPPSGSISGLTANGAVYATSGTAISSTIASTANGQFLQTTTAGAVPTWLTILGVANGGTGSSTQNWVDLTTTQSSIGGAKTFTSLLSATAGATITGATNINNTGSGSTTSINNTAGDGVLAIGNTTNAGSITNMTIGATGPNTGAFTTLSSTGTTSIGTGASATAVSIGNGVGGNTITIGNGINTSAQTIDIANGASAANSTVEILSGVGTAGTGTLQMGNNTEVTTIDLGNITPAAARTITIGGNVTTHNTVVDQINIGTGITTVGGGKTVNIANGTPTGSGTNLVSIGSTFGNSNTTINGGSGATGGITLNGNVSIATAGDQLSFLGTGTGVTTFQAGAQGSTNINYTLPTSAPTSAGTYFLSTTSTSSPYMLTWATAGSGTYLPLSASTAQTVANTTNSVVPVTINAASGQTADIQDWDVNGATKADVDKSGNINTTSGAYEIGGTSVLSSTTLGSGVTSSSLTSVGILGALTVVGTADINNTGTAATNINAAGGAATIGNTTTAGSLINMAIGTSGPNTGAFTTLSASSTVSGSGFSTYLASPPAIGGTAASTGKFTTLTATTAASGFVLGSGVNATTFSSGATAARAISFPDAGGTVALTSSSITGTASGLSSTLVVGSGGTGTTTAPTGAGQLLIAQSTSAYAPETVSGDIAITSGGVTSFGTAAENDIMTSVNAGSGILDVNNGGTGTSTTPTAAGQMLVSTGTSAYSPTATPTLGVVSSATGSISFAGSGGSALTTVEGGSSNSAVTYILPTAKPGASTNVLGVTGTTSPIQLSWVTNTSTTMPTNVTDGVAYYSGTAYALTTAGTSGQYLQSQGGGGTAPTWAQPGPASVQVLTSGTAYTTPAGVHAIMVECIGGGGGGGGSISSATNNEGSIGGAGGGGGYTRKLIVNPSGTYTYTIGSAGTAGTGGATSTAGGTGGTTEFNGTAIQALGGSGGAAGAAISVTAVGPGSAGAAVGSGGDFEAAGSPGQNSFESQFTFINAAAGGNSIFGGGDNGNIQALGNVTSAGGPGIGYGGGGSGAYTWRANNTSETGQNGGAGSAGVIIVTEYK